MAGSRELRLVLEVCEVDLATGDLVGSPSGTARLTERERRLLAFLAARPGETVGRDVLHAAAWDLAPTAASRAVDTAVRRLRTRIERDPAHPDHIITVHGAGYRFAPRAEAASARAWALGPVRLDLDRLLASRGAATVSLTPNEAAVLEVLAAHAPEPVPRERLRRAVWGDAHRGAARYVDLAVLHLRRKLEVDPCRPSLLLSVPGVGYRLAARPGPGSAASTGRTSNVGAPLDAFIGPLEPALTEIRGARLATLVGPPGVGKSRLAQELARATSSDHESWLVPVAPPGGAPVAEAVADALELAPDRDPVQAVARALGGRGPVLLVLDGAERRLGEVGAAAQAWLDAVPSLTVVVTSRERLRVPGEAVVRVAPLSVDDALALLVDRIDRLAPAWAWTDEARDAGRTLAARLDALPLALELVAARAAAIGPQRLLGELGDPLAPLADAVGRSWAVLSAERQRDLVYLAAFRGGFGLVAADAVLGPSAPDALQDLRDASWLVPSPTVAGEVRFELLDTLCAFVERAASEVDRADARRAHALWCAGLAPDDALHERENLDAAFARFADAEPALALGAWCALSALAAHGPGAPAPPPLPWLDRWADAVPPASHGRARVLAARVAGRSGDLAAAEAQLDLARALLPEPDADPAFSGVAGNLAARRGRFRQARLHYQRVLAADPGPADAQRAWVGLAKVRLARGDPDGATRLLARAPRDAAALATLAQIHQRAGRYDAAGRALDRARRASVGDAAALASIDGLRAALAVDAGDLAGAECAYAELQQRHARRGDRAARAIATGNRASVRVVQGRVDGVDELLDEALVAHRATGDHKLVTTCLATRGQLRQLQGRPDDAVECYDDAAALAAEGGAWADWATVRTMGAVALAEAGRLDDARRWLEGLGDLGVPDHVQRAERALRRCEGAPVPDAPTPGNDDVARWLDRRAEASVTHPNRHRPARA